MKTHLTLDDINNALADAAYYVFPGTTTTVCGLTLKDGFTVIGMSACVDAQMFNEATGRSIAHADALRQVWQLEGYLLTYKLAHGVGEAEAIAADAVERQKLLSSEHAALHERNLALAVEIEAATEQIQARDGAIEALQAQLAATPPAEAPAPAPVAAPATFADTLGLHMAPSESGAAQDAQASEGAAP